MKATCPHCNAALNIPDGYSAMQAHCPQCKRAFEISEPEEEYAEAGTSPVFTVLSAVAVCAAFVLGNVSGYYIAQPKRNAAQREAAAAKAEILRLSEAGISSTQAPQQKAKDEMPAYRIVEMEDFSFSTTVRLGFRIQIDKRLSEYDLLRICEKIVAKEKIEHPHNAISFMFYLPGTDTNGGYTGGTADWAPYGDWDKADSVAKGDYSKHRLVVKVAKQEQQRLQSKITQLQIVCDKFNLVTEVTGSTLDLSVDTDLPDNTVVMVSVTRSYWEKGNSAAYVEDYFSESSTIGKWKSHHRISIASEKWKSALRTKQEKMSKIGLGFDVASVSDKINVSMVVPINQTDPMFGDRNENLTGKAVIMASKGGRTTTGKVVGPMYVVEGEIEIDYPLSN